MATQRFSAKGSDGKSYTVVRIGSSLSTTGLDSEHHTSRNDGLARWQLANGDVLNPTGERGVFTHFGDPSLRITLD